MREAVLDKPVARQVLAVSEETEQHVAALKGTGRQEARVEVFDSDREVLDRRRLHLHNAEKTCILDL